MFGLDLLNNTGIQFIGDQQKLLSKEKTLIVVGIARGGTSLIAGTLDHLGIFTGDLSNKPVFEDVKLATSFENNDIEKATDIINEYNNKNNCWAFKRPRSINYNDKINSLCRNPIYLFVFKDIFAVSNRNNISMKSDIISGLQKAHQDYSKILEFISNNDLTGFLFSYEKVMGNKEAFVDLLIDVIGQENVTQNERESALNFIEPNPKEYLHVSRITRGIGQIGSIQENCVVGWGKYAASEKTAIAELYINDKLIDSVEAKDFRQHALDSKIHSSGHCGYVFNLKTPLIDGDKVSVKLSEDVEFLRNSNQIFKKNI